MLVLSAGIVLSPSSTRAAELLVMGIAGCRSPSPAVFSPSSTWLSVLRYLQKYPSIPGWLEVGFLLLMGTR